MELKMKEGEVSMRSGLGGRTIINIV